MSASPRSLHAHERRVASVAHDLRSPLNGIKTWTHVLENHLGGTDATVRRAIAGILAGIDQQVRLIDGLLDEAHATSAADPKADSKM